MINAFQLIARWTHQSGLTPKEMKVAPPHPSLLTARGRMLHQKVTGLKKPRHPSSCPHIPGNVQECASVPPLITQRFHHVPTIPQIIFGRGEHRGWGIWRVWVVSGVFRWMAAGYCSIRGTDEHQKSIWCQHPKYKVLSKHFRGFYDYYDHSNYASSPQRMCTFAFKEPIWPLQGFC